jgi:hypothetical protein
MLKIVIITMLKNEADILPLWLKYHLPYVDAIYMVDHNSNDGTSEYIDAIKIKSGKIIKCSYKNPAYFQSQILTSVARKVYHDVGDCWIIPLDIDEFIPHIENGDFRAFCNSLNLFFPVKMPWNNCVPLYIGNAFEKGHWDLLLKSPAQDWDHGKLIFHSKMVNSENFILAQGAHAISCDNRSVMWGYGGWPILHLPIRSKIQFMLKILQGIYSYLKIDPAARSSELGYH